MLRRLKEDAHRQFASNPSYIFDYERAVMLYAAARETASNQQEREQMENTIKELLTEIENNYIIKKKAEARHMPSFYYNQDRSF